MSVKKTRFLFILTKILFINYFKHLLLKLTNYNNECYLGIVITC